MDAADQQVVLEERDYEQILDRYLQGLAPQTRQSISLVVQELKRKGSSFKILPLQSATTSSSSKQPSIPFKNPAEVVTPSAATRAKAYPQQTATAKCTTHGAHWDIAFYRCPNNCTFAVCADWIDKVPSAGNIPQALGEKDASVSPGGMSKTALAMAKVRAQLRMDEAEKKTQILQQRVAEVEAELAKAKAELVLHQEEHLKRKREFDDARAAIEEVSRAAKRRKTDEVDQPAPSIEQENDSASAAPLLGSKRPPTRLDGKAIWEERSKKARRSSAADAFNTFVPVPTPPPAAVQPQIDRPSFALSPTTPNPKSAIEEDNEFVLTSDGPIDIDTGPSKLPVVKRPSAPDGSALNAPADGATNAIPAALATASPSADDSTFTSGAEIAAVPDKAVVLFEGHRTAPGTKGAVATSLGESGTGDVVLKSLGVRITADILAKARMLAAAGNKSLQQQQQEQVALHPKRATGPADLRPRGTSPQETTNTVVSSGNVGLVSGPATVPGDAGAPVFELGSSPGVGSGHSSKVQNSSNGSAKHSQVDSGSRSVNLASGASTSSLLNASLLDRVVAAAAAASAPPPAPPAPPLQWQSQSAMLANAGPVHNMQQPQQQRLETQHAQPQAQQLPQQPPQQLLLQLQQQQLLQQQQQQQQYQQMLLLQHLQQQQQLQQQMQQPHQAPHHQQQQQLQQHQQRQEQQQQVHVQNYQQPMSGPQIPGNPYFAQFAAQLGMITGPPLQAGAVAAAAAGWLGPMRAPGGGGSLGPMGAGGGGGAATAAVAPGGMMQMMTAGNIVDDSK
ncbi:hypothetical protein DFJ73DRAFT_774839 [Zopfochytrium polystomum]|nr:hypothetical protein DFJ73DRAFT_774839 [Zopfochytrium polystomum]